MVRANCSSLKAHRSSIDPPPRTSKIRSSAGAPGSGAQALSLWMACTSSPGALVPCTDAGAITTAMCGTRRCKAVTTSCRAAAPKDVTTPMARGMVGNARLRAASNKPSRSNLALSRRNCSNSAPCPAGRMLSTTNCNSPRGSYTATRPRSSTRSPSLGANSSKPAARRNMAQRIWPVSSLSEK